MKSAKAKRPSRSFATIDAFRGFLYILPFFILNTIIVQRIEPVFSLIRPTGHTSPIEYVLLAIVLFLIPIGAFVAARPMLATEKKRKRKLYLVNIVIAGFLLVAFILLASTLGAEIYRCDILQVPNCD